MSPSAALLSARHIRSIYVCDGRREKRRSLNNSNTGNRDMFGDWDAAYVRCGMVCTPSDKMSAIFSIYIFELKSGRLVARTHSNSRHLLIIGRNFGRKNIFDEEVCHFEGASRRRLSVKSQRALFIMHYIRCFGIV